MKKRLLTLFFGCFIVLNSSVFGEDLVARFTHSDFAPYFTQDEGYEHQGLLVRMVDDIFVNKLGIKVEHNYKPYARAIMEFKNGEIPIHLGAPGGFSEDDMKSMHYIPMVRILFGFFSFDSKQIEFNEFKDLSKYTIGSYNGGIPSIVLETEGLVIERKASAKILVKMLDRSRLDFACTEVLGFATISKTLFPNRKLYLSDKILLATTGGIFFTSKHPDGDKLYALFIKELIDYRNSGEFKKIAKEYYDNVGWSMDKFVVIE